MIYGLQTMVKLQQKKKKNKKATELLNSQLKTQSENVNLVQMAYEKND